MRGGIAFALGNSGEIAKRQGHPERAVGLFGEALKLHRDLGHRLDIPFVLEALALNAILLRQPRRAAHLWGAAAAWRQVFHAPIPLSYQADYAASIADVRTQLGDGAFSKAWAEGQALTLDQAIAEAEGLALSLGHPPPITPEYHEGLTAREVQVLRLLAEGLTDQQIADRLVLSKRTVQAHLRSIYAKLNVTSRSAATRVALDQKIV